MLRFFCLWDDRAALYGEATFVLHYTWRTIPWRCWRFRAQQPRRSVPVFRRSRPNKKLEVDALGPTKSYTYYTHKDLRVGNTVNVYGREFPSTTRIISPRRGISSEEYSEADFPGGRGGGGAAHPAERGASYNGLALADSLQNCVALIPKRAPQLRQADELHQHWPSLPG